MFYDTITYFLDDEETRIIKEYRRKSNYYEEKLDAINDLIDSINKKLKEANSYGISTNKKDNREMNNVLEYRYINKKNNIYEKLYLTIELLEKSRDYIIKEKNKVYNEYSYYYNLAIRG